LGKSNNPPKTTFQSIMDYKFTFKGQFCKKDAANYLDVVYDTFQRYCNGNNRIPIEQAKNLIQFVYEQDSADTELLEYFCPPGIIPVPAAQAALSDEQREKKELDLAIHLGSAIEAIEKAYKDGRVDKKEHKEIHRHLTRIRQRAAELDLEISREVR
jgi:hypothetical protein